MLKMPCKTEKKEIITSNCFTQKNNQIYIAWKLFHTNKPFNSEWMLFPVIVSIPLNSCKLESQSMQARTPVSTIALKAFFTIKLIIRLLCIEQQSDIK